MGGGGGAAAGRDGQRDGEEDEDEEDDVLAPVSFFFSNPPSKLDLTHIYIHIAHYMINTHVLLIATMALFVFAGLGPSS